MSPLPAKALKALTESWSSANRTLKLGELTTRASQALSVFNSRSAQLEQGVTDASSGSGSLISSSNSGTGGGGASAKLQRIGLAVNDVTGYSTIDTLKQAVQAADRDASIARAELNVSKLAYNSAVDKRNDAQRQLNSLLQRKSSWSNDDVSAFTALCMQEHTLDQEVAQAKVAYDAAGAASEAGQTALLGAIRERYAEETLWSDKIRRASTWWTWGLMALHFASFVVVYTVLEPRKQQRLRDAVGELLQQETAAMRQLVESRLPMHEFSQAAQDHFETMHTADDEPAGIALYTDQKHSSAHASHGSGGLSAAQLMAWLEDAKAVLFEAKEEVQEQLASTEQEIVELQMAVAGLQHVLSSVDALNAGLLAGDTGVEEGDNSWQHAGPAMQDGGTARHVQNTKSPAGWTSTQVGMFTGAAAVCGAGLAAMFLTAGGRST